MIHISYQYVLNILFITEIQRRLYSKIANRVVVETQSWGKNNIAVLEKKVNNQGRKRIK
jgi:hypothetical protein